MTQQIQTFAAKTLQNYIDNAHVATEHWDIKNINDPKCFIPVHSPASAQIIAYCPISTKKDVDLAVASSKTAFETWSAMTVKTRVQYLIRFHQLVIKHSDELADLIVLEHGKTKAEALAEIAKGNETVEYAISLPQLTQGKILQVSRGVTCYDVKSPLGVVASIVPFNFPFMVPFWTLAIAIGCGNCILLKPSEKVPLTMNKVMDLFRDAGLPDGVVNLLNGAAETVQSICDHKDVKAVTFVGTSKVAEFVSHRCRLLNKRVIALGGAKNHLVASPDALVDMTAQDVVNSFTGCAGQRCMAASVLLTIGHQPELIKAIVEKAGMLVPGQDAGVSNIMGPVIDKASKDKIISYIEKSQSTGAKILLDGRKNSAWAKKTDGYWLAPTIILHSHKTDAALHDEIFGPVLSIYEVKSKEEAIEMENSNPYGNAACIYTVDGGVAEWFTNRFSAGMLGVNIGVPVPREPFSFGGINNSKYGGEGDITGEGSIDFFTVKRKVTAKWAPPVEKSWMN